MVQRIFTITLILIISFSCKQEPLEKQNVPIFLAISTDENINYNLLKTTLDSLTLWNIKAITLIINYEHKSSLQNSLKLLKKINFPFNIQIEFPNNLDTLTKEHLNFIYSVVDSIKKIDKTPLRFLIKLRNNNLTFSIDEITNYIRNKFPESKIAIYSRLHEVERMRTYDFDEIAYQYDYPPLRMSYRAIARRIHPLIEKKIKNTNKKLFIEIYLQKKDADKQLINLLRFWSKDFTIKGIQLSTLYGKTVLTDSTSPLGLQKDYKLKQFLINYGKNSNNTP